MVFAYIYLIEYNVYIKTLFFNEKNIFNLIRRQGMANCTTELWTLKNIRDSLEKEWKGDKKIVIPMFQRGKRWNKEKKDTFIDSLRKRYPIGTLLFYKTVDETQEIYTLIDGLQRGSAIKEYLSNPSKFFVLKDIDDKTLETLYSLILSGGNVEAQKDKINEIISTYINSLNKYEDLEVMDLYNLLKNEFPILSEKSEAFSEAIKPDFKNLKEDYNNLSQMTIPAIVYTGEQDTLPEIFERINSKGVALTEYEIYAASWPREEFHINNIDIVNPILSKYDLLNESEFKIHGYDREKKRIEKNVNAFEYTFGLSKYLQTKYYSLDFYSKLKDDETNPVAFQLLNACFNTSHSQIKDVHRIITRFKDNIDALERGITSSIEFVETCIDPISRFKGNSRVQTGKIFHSQFQIMSLISFVFRTRYETADGEIKQRSDWREKKRLLESNIWKYYVYDITTKYWGEGGTGKIHSANSENRYLNPLTFGQFSTAFDSYSEAGLSLKQRKQIANPSNIDYVILNTIYVNYFSAMDQLSINKFDVEHIATKDQMKKYISRTKGEGLPISHIANLCYLPEFENRSKGAKTFYQDDDYLNKANTTIELIENKYSFTSKNDLEFMNIEYLENDFDVLKSYYFEFLKRRNEILKKKFLDSLELDDVQTDDDQELELSVEPYSDKFFRTTKIGKLVRHCFSDLINNKKLTPEDVSNLQNREYSNKYLGCAYPILVLDSVNMDVNFESKRYYRDRLLIDGKEYHLCQEWYEHDRVKVVGWFKNKLDN